MKKISGKLLSIAAIILFTGINSTVFSQTSGSLSFSCNTTAPSANYGLKHVLAIWIENTQVPSIFIKTKAKYGSDDDHLTSWIAKSGGNLVDATTGPTLTSYGSRTVIWNGTGVNNVVVPDGSYKVFIEMGWGSDKVVNHAVTSFTFTKGSNSVHLTPTGTTNYSNVVIDWVPLATLIELNKDSDPSKVFPNPTDGLINLEIQNEISSGQVIIENSSGATVYQKTLEDGFTGKLSIDINSETNGLYLLRIVTPDQQFVYKIILQK